MTTSPSIVRRAVPQDRVSIWELFRLLHAENAIFSMSEQKVNWILDRVLYSEKIPETDTGMRGYMGVIGPHDALEGFILMVIGSWWYSEDFHLEELANFVHPDHRKSNHAKTLLGWSKHMSDKVRIPLVVGIVSNIRTAAKVRLYRRVLPECGSYFLYKGTTTALNGK